MSGQIAAVGGPASEIKRLSLPLDPAVVRELRAGDRCQLEGGLIGARDAAHRRIIKLLEDGHPLPFDLHGETIYYVGPSPAPDGRIIGAAGPTTAGRMDRYTPTLLRAGVLATIGKGRRSPEVVEAMVETGAVYLGAVGGAGALLARCITSAQVIAWDDLGPEAVYRFEVVGFPVVVVNDAHGGDLYER